MVNKEQNSFMGTLDEKATFRGCVYHLEYEEVLWHNLDTDT